MKTIYSKKRRIIRKKVRLLNYKLRYDLRKIRPCWEGSSKRFSSKPYFHLICRRKKKKRKGPTKPSKSCVWGERNCLSFSLFMCACQRVHAKQWLWELHREELKIVQFFIYWTSSTFHVFFVSHILHVSVSDIILSLSLSLSLYLYLYVCHMWWY